MAKAGVASVTLRFPPAAFGHNGDSTAPRAHLPSRQFRVGARVRNTTMDRTTVSYPLVFNLLGVDGTVLPLDAELRYTAADPLAVEALFDDGTDPIRWVFARDLLAAGLDQRTGRGDVMIWPTTDADGRPAVHLRLHSPDGDALLEASVPALEAFLAAAWRLVPPGTEQEHIDVDVLD